MTCLGRVMPLLMAHAFVVGWICNAIGQGGPTPSVTQTPRLSGPNQRSGHSGITFGSSPPKPSEANSAIQFGAGSAIDELDARGGATLEEVWGTNRLLMPEDTWGLLINSEQPSQPADRIQRKVSLTSDQILSVLRTILPVASEDWSGHNALVNTMIYDGEKGHCVNLAGIEKGTGDFVYWDPWGKSSFLAQGNNAAGVSARQVPKEPRFWRVTPAEFSKVVYACILSRDQWKRGVESKSPNQTGDR